MRAITLFISLGLMSNRTNALVLAPNAQTMYPRSIAGDLALSVPQTFVQLNRPDRRNTVPAFAPSVVQVR